MRKNNNNTKALIKNKEAKKIRLIDKIMKFISVIFKRIMELIKTLLIVTVIYIINLISIKCANIIAHMEYTQIRILIFSILSFIVIIKYLKTSEEIKQ